LPGLTLVGIPLEPRPLGGIAPRSATIGRRASSGQPAQGGAGPIPHLSNPQRVAGNFDVLGFALSADELIRIADFKRVDSRVTDPVGRAPAWD
jgi:hypothetical protein